MHRVIAIALVTSILACGEPPSLPPIPPWSPDAGPIGSTGDGGPPPLIDGCLHNNGGCPATSTCTSTAAGMTACTCPPGTEGDGLMCTMIDVCADAGLSCDVNATCADESGTAECECNPGYAGNGMQCAPAAPLVAMSVGYTHTCGIDANAFLWCWGDDTQGAVGSAALGLIVNPIVVSSGWAQVSAGNEYTCGVKTDGSLWCWGANGAGQLGVTSSATPTPQPVGPGFRWSAVAAGDHHTCAVRSDDTLWCWGTSTAGETGQPTGTVTMAPAQVSVPTPVVEVAVGSAHTCAIDSTGAVWCWGSDSVGQLGLGDAGVSSSVPAAVIGVDGQATAVAAGGDQACAIADGGTLWCWGANSDLSHHGSSGYAPAPTPMEFVELEPAPISEVTVGLEHACAMSEDGGTMACWGNDEKGQLGAIYTVPAVAQIAPGATWGFVAAGGATTCAELDTLSDTVSLSCGPDGLCCESSGLCVQIGQPAFDTVTNGPFALCWGDNEEGQLGNGTSGESLAPVMPEVVDDVVSFSAGPNTACAITSFDPENQLVCWGSNEFGQLGTGSTASVANGIAFDTDGGWLAVSVGDTHACGIQADGSLWCWGRPTTESHGVGTGVLAPAQLAVGVDDWQSVAAGGTSTCAIDQDGVLWCWGRNDSGQLGIASTQDEPGPMPVLTGLSWRSASVGERHACAIAADESLWCWGDNSFGELGALTTAGTNESSPVQAMAGGWIGVSAGNDAVCAVSNDNTLWCWGNGAPFATMGAAIAVPPMQMSQQSWTQVSLSSTDMCAVAQDSSIWCVGSDAFGQLGAGTPLGTSWGELQQLQVSEQLQVSGSAVFVGSTFVCALLGASVNCWGGDQFGQLGKQDWTATPSLISGFP